MESNGLGSVSMLGHLRAILWLLVLTLAICSLLYPLVLFGIGQAVFRDQAEGSLIKGPDGKALGSRLIAQNFTGDQYFQPRPSAVSYNAAASGATNWGANNYLLRDRVARILGPIVKYGKDAQRHGNKPRTLVGPDIEKWFQQNQYQGKSGILAQWANMHSGLAEVWIKSTADAVKGQWKKGDTEPEQADAFLSQWAEDLPELHKIWLASDAHADWKKQNPDKTPTTADLGGGFFEIFSKTYPGEWPTLEENETKAKEKRKKLKRVKESSEIQSVFFDMWRQDHPNADLELVPADMVMASASGLDPHITMKNALYQLERVAGKWAETAKRDPVQVRKEIETILRTKTESPLGGLVGEDLINVLEINLALRMKYET
jgi:potassium-transporting ATPase KdpC subunit